MARHIMAVCVVCLLCADRLPCQDHIVDIFPDAQQLLNAKVYQRTDLPIHHNPSTSKTTEKQQQTSHYAYNSNTLSSPPNSNKQLHHRRKRHADHTQSTKTPQITEYFLQRIFTDYEHDDNINNYDKMSRNSFQRILEQLHLQQLIGSNNNGTCIADKKLVEHVQPHDLSHQRDNGDELKHTHANKQNCSLTVNDTNLACAHLINTDDVHLHKNYTLSKKDMLNLCPVLLYQLLETTSNRDGGCIDSAVLLDIDRVEANEFDAAKDDIIYVWIYAFISVFACGILGLVGVAIIPFMDSRYYKHIIQYLVSLAVGTMTGDALLHLLPHALAGQSERNMIFKGLTCMAGIIFFYITEHGLTMISEWRKSIAKKDDKKTPRAKVMRDPDSSVNNSVAGDKICKSKYSSYPYCYDEIAMDHKQDVWMHLPNNSIDTPPEGANCNNEPQRLRNGKKEQQQHTDGEMAAAAQSLLSTSHNNYAEMNQHSRNNHHQHDDRQQQQQQQQHMHDSNTISTDLDGNAVGDSLAVGNGTTLASDVAVLGVARGGSGKDKEKDKSSDTVTVILREHESSHHGHSHRHGHVHSPPESLSAVAWMIIMGDGLHNFTDGMAIGAAFAENIAGGFSTSLAVFCHELPHELGDFAILIKAGMSVKTAVYYNLLTGILSFIGMIFGIMFGQSQDTAQWMFAAAAGLFIYIALVDMMPEISAAHKSIEEFALQIFGMLSGVMIMLLIAIYEGDLMNVFATTPTAGHHQHIH